MIAVDTNILVYAHRRDSSWNELAYDCITNLTNGPALWAIPWPCLHEFFSIVTHQKIYNPPSTTQQAVRQIDAWLEAPTLDVIGELENHWQTLKAQLLAGQIRGPTVHDARIVSICIANGVTELLTAERDFGRFAGLKARNPLVSLD